MTYVTVSRLAALSGLPAVNVRYHCRAGVLAGLVTYTDSQWLIPADVADRFATAARACRQAGVYLTSTTFEEPPEVTP